MVKNISKIERVSYSIKEEKHGRGKGTLGVAIFDRVNQGRPC